jgi:hypothetical protein
VDDNISVVDQFGEELAIFDVVEVIGEALGGLEVADILHATGGKIVEEDDRVSALHEALGQMRSDKAGTAGD